MSIAMRATSLLFLSLCLFAASTEAATYIVPRDAELVARADAIVVGTAVRSRSVAAPGGGIETVYELAVSEVVKGPFATGSIVALTEPGGSLGGRHELAVGAPRYQPGSEYLVFIEADLAGAYRTLGLGLGQFAFAKDANGIRYLERSSGICGFSENFEPHVELDRDAAMFLDFVRTIARGRVPARMDYFMRAAQPRLSAHDLQTASFTRKSYVMTADTGEGFRMQNPSASYWIANATAEEAQAANSGVAAWTSHGGSDINLSIAGTNNALPGANQPRASDGKNAIRFSDPPGSAGLAYMFGSDPYTLDGESFYNIFEADVSINTGLTGACLVGVVVHEVGHTLGFRHSDQCPPGGDCSNTAVMKAVLSAPNCPTGLLEWDDRAASTVYGSGPAPCTNAAITAQPQGSSIQQGQSATLSVTATGTSPTYQWYIGASGNTSQPISGAMSSSVSVTPSSTTTYWVRVTACGTPVNSTAATVTVNPAVCVPPSISSHPQSATIELGGTAFLSVSATGTAPLTYQWYRGLSGDTSSPVAGATGATVVVGPGTTTNYWARVTGACTPAANSFEAVVTVVPCTTVTVLTPVVRAVGTSFELSVNATGGTISSVQWFMGDTPGTGSLVATGNPITVSPTAPTSYWARVTNSCGNTGTSSVVRVEPAAVCTPPAITSITATPTTVDSGKPVVLSVTATGASLSYQWYQGLAGVTTTPVGNSNAASITVTPTANVSYWVRVNSGCGAAPASSNAVSVTVNTCVRPAITTQPMASTVKSGLRATLTVAASGTAPITYEWFQGEAGDVSKKVGSTATLTTDRLMATTKFWVRVTNICGSIDSNVVTVSVIPARVRAVRR